MKARSININAKRAPLSALIMILSLNESIEKIITYIQLKRYLITLFFLFLPLLRAQEPQILFLDAINANDSYLFHSREARYLCTPYGVWTLDRITRNSDISPVCKKALDNFIMHNPKLHYFVHYIMQTEEGYRVEFRNGRCIVYLGSKRTLSEVLLQNGVAIEEPVFSDEEFRYRFHQALRVAKTKKQGIWSDVKLRSCMSEFFKE